MNAPSVSGVNNALLRQTNTAGMPVNELFSTKNLFTEKSPTVKMVSKSSGPTGNVTTESTQKDWTTISMRNIGGDKSQRQQSWQNPLPPILVENPSNETYQVGTRSKAML